MGQITAIAGDSYEALSSTQITIQSLQCHSSLGWVAHPLQRQDIQRPPSSPSPHSLMKLSLRTTEKKLFIPGLWCWEHRQMAPELAAQQIQKVLNTINSNQPELLPTQPSVGSSAVSPFLGRCSSLCALLTQVWCQPEAQREDSGSKGLRKRRKVMGVVSCHLGGAETAAAHWFTLSFHVQGGG